MIGGFNSLSPANTLDPTAVSSMPADVDTGDGGDDSDSSDSDTPPAKQQSPFSTLNTPNQPQSPFSTLNTGTDGAIGNSPFSTLADPSLVNPLGPYGNPANLLRTPYGIVCNQYGTGLPFGMASPSFGAYGVAPGLEQPNVLDNPAFQSSLV